MNNIALLWIRSAGESGAEPRSADEADRVSEAVKTSQTRTHSRGIMDFTECFQPDSERTNLS